MEAPEDNKTEEVEAAPVDAELQAFCSNFKLNGEVISYICNDCKNCLEVVVLVRCFDGQELAKGKIPNVLGTLVPLCNFHLEKERKEVLPFYRFGERVVHKPHISEISVYPFEGYKKAGSVVEE